MAQDEERRDRTKEPYLAAEVVGGDINLTLPDDPLIARMLLEELRHAVEARELHRAFMLQQQVKAASGNGIVPGDARMLDRIRPRRLNG